MKRGFTLIEMLGILVILSVIILLSLPSIIQTNRNTKQAELDDTEKTILMAAETYLEINDTANQSLKVNNYYYVPLSTLITEGLLPSNTKNPLTKLEKAISEGDYWVEARINNGNTVYEIVAENPYEGESANRDLAYNILIEKSVVKDKNGVTGRYIFTNSRPNNYVKFNNETWRIVALEADKTIKIVRDDFLEMNYIFGTNNVVSSSSLLAYLNGNYYTNILISSAQDMIKEHAFPSGTLTLTSLSGNISSLEKNSTITKKVGLLSPSDYIQASEGAGCTASASYGATAADPCSNNNYLMKDSRWWLMHAASSGGNVVISDGYDSNTDAQKGDTSEESKNAGKCINLTDKERDKFGLNSYPSNCYAKVRPAIYLKETVAIISGDGSITNPYVLASN